MKQALKWALPLIATGFLVLVMIGWQRDLDAADLQSKYANSDSQFIDVGGGLLVHVRDEGKSDAPILVLLHDANGSLQAWERWMPQIAVNYRVITLDLPGNGLTGPHPARDYSAQAFVKVIDALTRKLGAQKFIIGGHSMGGWIAWNYALAHPERVTGLVLIAVAGAPNAAPTHPPLVYRLADYPGMRPLALYITPRAFIKNSLMDSVSVKSTVDERMVSRYWELILYPGNRRATRDRVSLLNTQTATQSQMKRIRVPTLILAGAEDPVIPVNGARWFARAISGAKLVIYKGVGHFPMEEAPAATAKDVTDFLAGLAQPSQK